MKKIVTGLSLGGLLVAVLGLAVPAVSQAAYFSADKNVAVASAAAINDNAYVAGTAVSVASPINGDLLAAGSTVYVSGKVSQDIMAAGGTVILSGATADDVRLAAGTIIVSGAYSGELAAVGGQVTVAPDAAFAKDSYVAAGAIMFNGNEGGSLTLSGGTVYVNGIIAKDLVIRNAKEVTIGANAVIKGNFEYTSTQAAVIENGAQIKGVTTFHESKAGAANGMKGQWAAAWVAFFTFWWFVKLLATLVLAYLLWYAFRSDTVAVVSRATGGFWKEVLRGFIVLVAVPIAGIIALFTLIGALPALIAGMVYGILIILACAISGIVVASLLMRRRTDLAWYHILLGVVLLYVVELIPFIGCLAGFVIFLAAFGATAMAAWLRFEKKA